MIPTLTIRDALVANLTASTLFEKVISHKTANLGEALEHLRDSPDSLAVVVPGEDKFFHDFIPGTNFPVRAECRNIIELLVSDRELDMREDGAPDCLTFKDAVLERLLYADLATPDLLCLPMLCEPMIVTFEEKNSAGREAWKITLEIRHTHHI